MLRILLESQAVELRRQATPIRRAAQFLLPAPARSRPLFAPIILDPISHPSPRICCPTCSSSLASRPDSKIAQIFPKVLKYFERGGLCAGQQEFTESSFIILSRARIYKSQAQGLSCSSRTWLVPFPAEEGINLQKLSIAHRRMSAVFCPGG